MVYKLLILVYYQVSCGVVGGWVLNVTVDWVSDPAGALCELPRLFGANNGNEASELTRKVQSIFSHLTLHKAAQQPSHKHHTPPLTKSLSLCTMSGVEVWYTCGWGKNT